MFDHTKTLEQLDHLESLKEYWLLAAVTETGKTLKVGGFDTIRAFIPSCDHKIFIHTLN